MIPGSRDVLELISKDLHRHLNFQQEAQNISRMKQLFKDDSEVLIPDLYDYDNEMILMERLPGVTLEKLESEDQKWAVNLLLNKIYQMIFVHGFVHGDLHEGNFLFANQKIGFVDLGIVHELSSVDIILLKLFFQSLFTKDFYALTQIMTLDQVVDVTRQSCDITQFIKDVQNLADETDLYWILDGLIRAFNKNKFKMHDQLIYPILVLINAEGIAKAHNQSLMKILCKNLKP